MLAHSRRETLRHLATLAFGLLFVLCQVVFAGTVTYAEECEILWCGGGIGPTPTPTATPTG